MPLIREVAYVVDDSQLKASDAEIARSEEKLQGLLRQRAELLANRTAGGTFDRAEFESQTVALQGLNAAIEAQRGTLAGAQAAQSEYSAQVSATSNLLREFAGITYDGTFWRDAKEGLMSPGEVAAVVSQYKDMEKVLEKIAGIKFDPKAGPQGAGSFVDTNTGLSVSSEDVQNSRAMIESLAGTDQATASALGLGQAFNTLRSQILPTSQTANGFTNLLEQLVMRQTGAAASSLAQSSAASASGSAMQAAAASATALRAALGGIILQALITFITLGVSALGKMKEAQQAAAAAAREHRNEIDELVQSVRRLAAAEAFSGRQRLSQRIRENADSRETLNASLVSLNYTQAVPNAFNPEVRFGINRTLIDRLVSLEAINAEEANVLESGQTTVAELTRLRTKITSVRDRFTSDTLRLGDERDRLDVREQNNPGYQVGRVTAERDAITSRGVEDSPRLRELNAELQRREEALAAAEKVGTIDRGAERRAETAAQTEARRLAREQAREAAKLARDQARDARDAEKARLEQAAETAATTSTIYLGSLQAEAQAVQQRAGLARDSLATNRAMSDARIALLKDESERHRAQVISDAGFDAAAQAASLREIQATYDAKVALAAATLEAEKSRPSGPGETAQQRANALATAVAENGAAITRAADEAETARSAVALNGTRIRLARAQKEADETARIIKKQGDDYAARGQEYAESEEGRLEAAAQRAQLLDQGRVTSLALVSEGLRDLNAALDTQTDPEKRAALQVYINLYKRLGETIDEATESAAASRTDRIVKDLGTAVKLADDLGDALEKAGLGFAATIAQSLSTTISSIQNAVRVAGAGRDALAARRLGDPFATATSAERLATLGAFAGAAGAIAGAVGGVVSALSARAERERELRRAIQASELAVDRNTDALLSGQIGADLNEAQIAAGRSTIDRLNQVEIFDFLGQTQRVATRDTVDQALSPLEAAGINVDDLRTELFAAIDAGNFEAFQRAIEKIRRRFEGLDEGLGSYSRDFEGATSQFAAFVRFTGTEGMAAIREWTRLLLASGENLGDVGALVSGAANMTDAERQAEIARIYGLLTNDNPDDFSFGSLTPSQVLAILDQVRQFGSTDGQGPTSTSTVRSVTEVTASELLAYAQEQLRGIRRAADGIDVSNSLLDRLVTTIAGMPPMQALAASKEVRTGDGVQVGPNSFTFNEGQSPEEIGRIAGQEVERQVRGYRLRGQGGRTSKG